MKDKVVLRKVGNSFVVTLTAKIIGDLEWLEGQPLELETIPVYAENTLVSIKRKLMISRA